MKKRNSYGYDLSRLTKFDIPIKYNDKTKRLDIVKDKDVWTTKIGLCSMLFVVFALGLFIGSLF